MLTPFCLFVNPPFAFDQKETSCSIGHGKFSGIPAFNYTLLQALVIVYQTLATIIPSAIATL